MFFRWKQTFAALAACLGLLALSSSPFDETTTIEGTVNGPDGKPVKGAVVSIERIDGAGSYSVKTDKKGHYDRHGLPVGVFDVRVAVGGREQVVKNVRPGPTMPGTVNFDLRNQSGDRPEDAARADRPSARR